MATIPMEPLGLPFFVTLTCAVLFGCSAKVSGTYQLDFEETKRAVLKAVEAHPAERARQEEALQLLGATRLTIRLLEGGKMETTTELVDKSAVTPPPRAGSWRQEGRRLVMEVEEQGADGHAHEKEPVTQCEIDGPRLRCFKPMPQKLFENYVLLRK